MTNSRFDHNTAKWGGGIAQGGPSSSLNISNTAVINNIATGQGGGVNLENTPNSVLTNCIIAGNRSLELLGAGFANLSTSGTRVATLINCTITGNISATGQAVVTANLTSTGSTTTRLRNTIVAHNTGGNFSMPTEPGGQAGILVSEGNNLDSDGSSGFTHGANGDLLLVDPLFVSAADFRLQSCSPAVNAGNDALNETTLDIIGNTRKFGVIDMGAYELQQAGTNTALTATGLQVAKTIEANDALSFVENCTLLAGLKSGGVNPVEGNVEARVWVQTVQPTHNGRPYVQRHYEIAPDEPDENAPEATGTVTLYFTQAEFNAFNDVPGNNSFLPTGPDDGPGIANFAIYKYSGRSADETGLPGSYPQPGVMLAAPEVQLTWNEARQWWEATFEVEGFSGFFAGSTGNNVLPISDLLDFGVSRNGEGGAAINWRVLPEHGIGYFEVEKSYSGRSFATLQRVPVRAGITTYGVTDILLQPGTQYYRLKLVDTDGSVSHSHIKAFHWDEIQLAEVRPNPVGDMLNLSLSAVKAGDLEVKLINLMGQTTVQRTFGLVAGPNVLSMEVGNLSGGVYFLHYRFCGASGFLRVVKE